MIQSIRNEVIDTINSIGNVNANANINNYLDGLESSAIYEIYIFSLVIKSVNEIEEVNVNYTRLENLGVGSDTLKFSGNPSSINSPNNYTYAVFKFRNIEYEIHLGVKYQGKTIPHELDISIISKAKADECRRTRKHPTKSAPLLAIECKFYSSVLGIKLGREFVGLLSDFEANLLALFVSNNGSNNGLSSASLVNYFSKKDRPYYMDDMIPFLSNDTPNSKVKNFMSTLNVDLRKILANLSI